jgi:ABC-2 type transport system permease protein
VIVLSGVVVGGLVLVALFAALGTRVPAVERPVRAALVPVEMLVALVVVVDLGLVLRVEGEGRRGEFYRSLVRPVDPLFSLLSERFFHPDGLGELVVGAVLVGYAGSELGLSLTAVQWALAPLLVLCGALLHTSVKLFFASLSFWTVTSMPAMYAANQVSEFSSYPLDIYHPSLRTLLTWVLPFAFTAYVPSVYLLTGARGLLGWLPLVTAGALALALTVWRRGVNRYEMTGS